MANQNVTQLSQQTGSATTSSLFYAVTGGNTDTGLPLSVLVNNLGLTGTPTTPTATTGTNTTQIASTAFVQATVASYAPLASPTFTGTVVIPTVTLSAGTINSTSVGATTASTGAFTTLSASSTVSGTGFTNLFASPSPIGSVVQNTGSFTTLVSSGAVNFSSMTVGSTSVTGPLTVSQTAGIIGTTTNNNVTTGSIGEYVTATTSGTSVPSTNAVVNATSMTLSAGDWDVEAITQFVPAGTSTVVYLACSVSTTSATLGGFGNQQTIISTFTAGNGQQLCSPVVRLSLATSTTVYNASSAGFGVSTMAVNGILRARRVR